MAIAVRVALPLDELAQTIQHEHALVEEAGQSMVEHAILAGEALLEAKAQVLHGEWETWLAQVFPSTALTTPRVYMRLARFAEDVRAGNPPTLKAARRMLSGGAHATVDGRIVSEAQRMRAQGATYETISDELGLAKSTVYRYVDPKAARKHKARAMAVSVKARRALAMEERAKTAKRVGGDVAKGYSLIRRALQALDTAQLENPRARRDLSDAIHRLYDAEEALGRAMRNEVGQ